MNGYSHKLSKTESELARDRFWAICPRRGLCEALTVEQMSEFWQSHQEHMRLSGIDCKVDYFPSGYYPGIDRLTSSFRWPTYPELNQ